MSVRGLSRLSSQGVTRELSNAQIACIALSPVQRFVVVIGVRINVNVVVVDDSFLFVVRLLTRVVFRSTNAEDRSGTEAIASYQT